MPLYSEMLTIISVNHCSECLLPKQLDENFEKKTTQNPLKTAMDKRKCIIEIIMSE